MQRRQWVTAIAVPCPLHAGVCPPLPGYLQEQASSQHTQDDMRLAQPVELRQIRYTVRSPKAMEFKAWALAPAAASMQHTDKAPGSPMPGSPTAVSSRVFEDAPCCFSAAPLQQLSLALGVMNLQLQRLVLDHTRLGDQGISTLTTGLANCSSLKVLSLRYCGIGPAGAQRLAEALVPACKKQLGTSTPAATAAAGPAGSRMSMGSINPQLATALDTGAVGSTTVGRSSSAATASISTTAGSSPTASREPLLLEVHMSGNPLGAAGLHAVNKAVRLMSSWKVLTLADISLDCSSPAAQLEVQVLAHSLLAGPNELSTLDFTNNHISKCAATKGHACADPLTSCLLQYYRLCQPATTAWHLQHRCPVLLWHLAASTCMSCMGRAISASLTTSCATRMLRCVVLCR